MEKKSMQLIVLMLLACSTMFFSACVKTYKLVPSESSQGKEHEDKREVIASNLRSVRVYDQWQTRAMFDVLWMSESVRSACADIAALRRGGSSKKVEESKGESEEYFYILADIRDQFHPELDDKEASWTIYLQTKNGEITPKDITKVKLSPEVLSLFGHRFPRPKFKESYKVTFPADALKFAVERSEPFKMIMGSVSRSCELGWQGAHKTCVKKVSRSKKGKLIKDEDYYWL